MRPSAKRLFIAPCKRSTLGLPASRPSLLPSATHGPSAHLQPKTTRRNLNVAPPFLLDDYTPRYQLLLSVDAARKRSEAYAHLKNCNLCPRNCGVNRFERAGACLIEGNTLRVGTVAPHFGEESCIQGHHGSGSVFLSGCNLRCVFCQNHDIAHTRAGFELAPEDLADWMLKLQDLGNVHNINLVTPEHVVPQLALAILSARDKGLKLPIVYNTSAYDSLASLELMDGLVDIYLPDFKVWEPATSARLLKAEDYAVHAREAIRAMHRQVGDLCLTGDNIAKSGVLVRHLVMPEYVHEGVRIVEWLAREVSTDLVLHVMEQYHPRAHVGKARRGRLSKAGETATTNDPQRVTEPGGVQTSVKEREVRYAEINRPVEEDEVGSVRKAAEAAGLWRFIQPAKHGGFNI